MIRIFELAHGIRTVLAAAAILCGCAGSASAANDSPVGMWRIINDDGQAEGIMKIYETEGSTVAGRLVKTFIKENETKVCARCSDDRKGKPFVGLEVIRGLRKDGDEYVDGSILDPDAGTIYGVQIKVVDEGQKLLMRGYLGTPLLGQTQTWVREE